MSLEYLGAIKLFAGNFAIKGYSFANGTPMSISQNNALFSLFGTYYGGDGVQTFNLPDLRSQVPIGQGNGSGLSPRVIGEIGGSDDVTVLPTNLPIHNHLLNATSGAGSTATAGPNVLLGSLGTSDGTFYSPATAPGHTATLGPRSLSMTGGNLPHNNIMPSLAINYLVALEGIYPVRN